MPHVGDVEEEGGRRGKVALRRNVGAVVEEIFWIFYVNYIYIYSISQEAEGR